MLRWKVVTKHAVDAIYEDGVFRPLTPIEGPLAEGQRVRMLFEVSADQEDDPLEMLDNFYEGMSEEDIAEIEKIMLDRSNWRSPRESP
ncbi:MAG TPA: antitoxin family protein [Chloroflexia bacterium]|jgi:predicted DNA-binding antitoxin AbrB/MazE fold protein